MTLLYFKQKFPKRVISVLVMLVVLAAIPSLAEPLSLNDYAPQSQHGDRLVAAEKAKTLRACLSEPRPRKACIGMLQDPCTAKNKTLEQCLYREMVAWNTLGFEVYKILLERLPNRKELEYNQDLWKLYANSLCPLTSSAIDDRLTSRLDFAICNMHMAANRAIDLNGIEINSRPE